MSSSSPSSCAVPLETLQPPSPDSSDLVHVSKDTSRQLTPFSEFDEDTNHDRDTSRERRGFEAMPSDLRPSLDMEHKSSHHQPLLSSDKARQSYDSESHHGFSSPRRLRERDPHSDAAKATRKRYTYAACFLLVSLVSFAIQTETAVYIQHNLHWNKAYCMLYFTHGSWSILYPIALLALRLQKWQQPWPQFLRRHYLHLTQTARMVRYRSLHIDSYQQKQSPWPYMFYTTAYVTCALTLAGGSWYVAVDLTTASDLTAIYNCSAFFAYAFAVPLLREKLSWSKMIAVGIAILGVLTVAYGDQGGSAKHGSKSGGGAGGPHAPDNSEADNRLLGNIVIGIGSVLYGFYEVLYKKVACPPDGTSPGRGVIFANLFGTMIGVFTLTVLWIPLPILHFMGWETFELPRGEAAWMLLISVFANATFSGSFLVLISLTSPVLSSVAALLTIFLVALCDEMLPPPLYSPITAAAMVGGLMIIFAFLLLSWSTYVEMREENEREMKAEERIEGSDEDDR